MLRLFLILLAGIMLTTPAHHVAAQQDQARLKGLSSENEAHVWQAVGRLDADETGFCTATLIAPEFLLTAAHCVFSPRTGKKLAPEDLTFRAGLRKGKAAAERGITQIEPHPAYVAAGGATMKNIRYDVALLRLDRPIPTHELDPFRVENRAVTNGPVSL